MEHAAASSGSPNLLLPETLMVILTWTTFFILVFILQKFAFKPIMQNLQKREREIREALENADKAKAQLANIEEEKQKILNEAKSQGAQIVEEARKAAVDLASNIEAKSHKNALEIMQAAKEQIETEKQKMMLALRKESAEIAISLAGKIIKENMDQDKNRRLVEEAVKQL